MNRKEVKPWFDNKANLQIAAIATANNTRA